MRGNSAVSLKSVYLSDFNGMTVHLVKSYKTVSKHGNISKRNISLWSNTDRYIKFKKPVWNKTKQKQTIKQTNKQKKHTV